MPLIRVIIPVHLRTLARTDSRELQLEVPAPVTQQAVIDALEAKYPVLRGTVRDHDSNRRRPLVRFFACEQDLSNDEPDTPLPDAVINGAEPFMIIGAMAGG